MKLLLCALGAMLLVLGCASHPTRFNCEGHLRPINAPAPATAGTARP